MMVRSMIIVGMTAAIIISMPFSISNVSTVATIFILPMVVTMIVGRGASKPHAMAATSRPRARENAHRGARAHDHEVGGGALC